MGIAFIWNKKMFTSSRVMSYNNYLVVEGRWLVSNLSMMFISVYAPQSLGEKKEVMGGCVGVY